MFDGDALIFCESMFVWSVKMALQPVVIAFHVILLYYYEFKYYRIRLHSFGFGVLHRWCDTKVSFSLISSTLNSMDACRHSSGVKDFHNGMRWRCGRCVENP